MRMRWQRWALVAGGGLVICAGALLVQGCAGARQRQTPFMRSVGTVSMSTGELRARTLAYAYAFAGAVENAADAIKAGTSDPEVDTRSVQWKVHAVAAVQEAAFRTDPLAALADLWVLTRQMEDYFATGAGKDLFGAQQRVAIDASRALMEEIEDLTIRTIGQKRYDEGVPKVKKFIQEHPIRGEYFYRETIGPALADLTGQPGGKGLEAVGSLDERAQVMLERMPFYSQYIPKQVAWQAELMILENGPLLSDRLGLGELERLGTLDEISDQLAPVGDLAGRVDELIADERAAIFEQVGDELSGQREAIMEEGAALVRDERTAILDRIKVEREAVVRDIASVIRGEREAILADVERQRLETLDAFRNEILDQAHVVASLTVDQALTDGRSLVDHAIWRLAQLVAVAGVVTLIVVVALHRAWARPSAPGVA